MSEPIPGQVPDSIKPIVPREARSDFEKMPARDLATCVAQKLEAAKKAADPETSKDLLREAVRVAGIGNGRADIQRGYMKPFQDIARKRLYEPMSVIELLEESTQRADERTVVAFNEADYVAGLALAKGADPEYISGFQRAVARKREELRAEMKEKRRSGGVEKKTIKPEELIVKEERSFKINQSLMMQEISLEGSKYLLNMQEAIVQRVVRLLNRDDFEGPLFPAQYIEYISNGNSYDKEFISSVLAEFEKNFPERYAQICIDREKVRQENMERKAEEDAEERVRQTEIGHKYEIGGKEYTVTAYLSKGYYGATYIACDCDGGKIVLKMAHEGLDEEARKKFNEEPITLSTLSVYQESHNLTDNGRILTPIRIGSGETKSGRKFFGMSFAEGESLAMLLFHDAQFKEDEVILIGDQLCRVFEVLHLINKVYLDFKVDNIFYDKKKGKITVVDWNLLAPINKEGVDKDLTVIATTMLQLLGVKQEELKEKGVEKVLEKVSASPKLKSFLTKALNPDSSQRYQSAAQMRKDLEAITA